MFRFLLSGSHGFIGSNLKKRLVQEGNEVIHIDRQMRLCRPILAEFILETQPDYIIDCAAYGNHYFQTDENECFKANVCGLYNLLDVTRIFKYKGFINLSTTSHNLEASTFYGSTKSAGEYLVRSFVQKYDKPIVNIRPYSVFGENEWDFRFIPTICRQIKAGESITVSNVAHDWIYINDFIDGVMKVLKVVNTYRGISFGIGTGKRIENMEIAEALMTIANKEVPIIEGVKRSYEIANHEKMLEGPRKNDEVKLFQYAKTSLVSALRNVYEYEGERLHRSLN